MGEYELLCSPFFGNFSGTLRVKELVYQNNFDDSKAIAYDM